jgi:YgiT-type zinc finger domain-containing protein
VNCVICKNGQRKPGTTIVTLTGDTITLVVRGVPAEVCDNCGEEYLDEATVRRLDAEAKRAEREGMQVVVRNYAA